METSWSVLRLLFIYGLYIVDVTDGLSERIAVVSAVDSQPHSQENVWRLLRSFRLYMSNSYTLSIYICHSNLDVVESLQEEYFASGIFLYRLHERPAGMNFSTEHNNLQCTLQVADHLYRKEQWNIPVLFLDPNYFVAGDVASVIRAMSSRGQLLACASGISSLQYPQNICEMNMFYVHSSIGTPAYMLYNATLFSNWTASHILAVSAARLQTALHFFGSDMKAVSASSIYYHDSLNLPKLIDFSKPTVQSMNLDKRDSEDCCHIALSINFPQFNTQDIITSLLQPFFADHTLVRLLCGCDPLPPLLIDFGYPPAPYVHRKRKVFDIFLFNGEYSMLHLRLLLLSSVVDYHVIVESNLTFTGNPKPLYYRENNDGFAAYHDRIINVVIPGHEMPYPSPTHSQHIWENEYFSRNMVLSVLERNWPHSILRPDDIVIVGDVDEIPRVTAIDSLHAVYNHHGSPESNKAYKFNVDTYLYNFGCNIGDDILLQPAISACTVRIGKQIAISRGSPDAVMTSIRKFHQHESPIPFEIVVSPGGWHLSFFLSIDRIRAKLESYSHQNFRLRYQEDVKPQEASTNQSETEDRGGFTDDASGSGSAGTVAGAGENVLRIGNISIDKLRERIMRGEHLGDGEHYKKCKPVKQLARYMDDETRRVQYLWEHVVSSEEDMPMAA